MEYLLKIKLIRPLFITSIKKALIIYILQIPFNLIFEIIILLFNFLSPKMGEQNLSNLFKDFFEENLSFHYNFGMNDWKRFKCQPNWTMLILERMEYFIF